MTDRWVSYTVTEIAFVFQSKGSLAVQILYVCHALICFTCLCDCLHPPPGVAHLPHYPLSTYTCVFYLAVEIHFVCSNVPAVSLALGFAIV